MKTEPWFKAIQALETELSARDAKYRRNYRVYYDSFRGEDIRSPSTQPLGFYFSVEENMDRPPPVVNAARSAVDTVCSVMSQLKTRPFFNPVNGKFDTRKAAREVQRYIDALFDSEGVYTESPDIMRLAAVFEAGYFWINDIDLCIKKVRPWEFFYSQSEYQYGKMLHYHFRFDKYPISSLLAYIGKDGPDPTKFKARFAERYQKNPYDTCTYRVAYDLVAKKRIQFMDQFEIARDDIDFDEPNVAELYYSRPIKGGFSMSLIDMVYTLYLQINDICRKIGTAVSLTPANLVLVAKGQNQIKAATIKSDVGYIYEYSPIPGVSTPVQIVTPAPLDPEYVNLLNFFIDQVFKTTGISDMQALGERPASVQSGYAIDTLNNIFSNRQNVILVNYLKMQVDLARKAIKCFPSSFKIPGKWKVPVTMGEVKKQLDLLTIDISAASALSRDPKTKQDQVTKLVSSGLMSPSMAAQYLEMPDLEDVYDILNSAQEYNRWVVERVVKEGKLDFYQVTDMSDLFQLAVSELLQCAAAGEPREVLENLTSFISSLQANVNQMLVPANPGAPVQPGVPPQAVNSAGQQAQNIPVQGAA